MASNRTGHAIAPLLAVPSDRDGTELAHWQPQHAHHEAGHAIMFWRHGWHFDYATMQPRPRRIDLAAPLADHFWGLVRDHPRKIDTPAKLTISMQVSAAGPITQWWYQPGHDLGSDSALIKMFRRVPSDPHTGEDVNAFVRTAEELDRLNLASDSAAATGPESWLCIWRDAERQITCEVWPAVRAVAGELRHTRCRMRYRRAAELADAAMAWWRVQ